MASAQPPYATPQAPPPRPALQPNIATTPANPRPGTLPRVDPNIIPAQVRGPVVPAPTRDDAATAYRIPFELPGPERLFRMDSEEALFQRMRQEARERKPEELVFPEEPPLSREPYYGRDWPKLNMLVEPHFVCHGRLYFDEPNSERYGWDLGLFQPLVSMGVFVKDTVLFPYHAGTDFCRCYDCSKGKCLPGDPVPYLLYPPEWSLTGALAEGLTVAGLAAIFP
jgi:hypothetical protein